MTALDRRLNFRNSVLQYRPGGSAPAPAPILIVDQSHPFFFDHALDHVPGLLLLEGAVQAAQHSARAPCFVENIHAEFIKFAFFDAPITVHVTDVISWGRRICSVELIQDDILRARVNVVLSPILAPLAQSMGLIEKLTPCPGDLLNKERPENVLITQPEIKKDRIKAHLLPMSGECLLSDSSRAVHPLYLLEAFMQVQRYLNATQDGDHRVRDILTGVKIEQSAPVATVSNVSIQGSRSFQPAAKGKMIRGASIRAGFTQFAYCTIETARLGKGRKST